MRGACGRGKDAQQAGLKNDDARMLEFHELGVRHEMTLHPTGNRLYGAYTRAYSLGKFRVPSHICMTEVTSLQLREKACFARFRCVALLVACGIAEQTSTNFGLSTPEPVQNCEPNALFSAWASTAGRLSS